METEAVVVSEVPVEWVLVLWVPVFAVILWSMFRLFMGRWIEDPPLQMDVDYEPEPELFAQESDGGVEDDAGDTRGEP